jgi:hypothetical protein
MAATLQRHFDYIRVLSFILPGAPILIKSIN